MKLNLLSCLLAVESLELFFDGSKVHLTAFIAAGLPQLPTLNSVKVSLI